MGTEAISLEHVASILKTIAHPVRLTVLKLLESKKRLSVGDMCDELSIEQSVMSHHLNLLKLHGILKSERSGRQTLYFISLKEVLKVIGCMEKCNQSSFLLFIK